VIRERDEAPTSFTPPKPPRLVWILRRDELQCFCGEPFVHIEFLQRQDLLVCGARKDGKRCNRIVFLLAGLRIPVFPEPDSQDLDTGHRFLTAEVTAKEVTEMESLRLEDPDAILAYLGFKGPYTGDMRRARAQLADERRRLPGA
jgi:hypothetical protein